MITIVDLAEFQFADRGVCEKNSAKLPRIHLVKHRM